MSMRAPSLTTRGRFRDRPISKALAWPAPPVRPKKNAAPTQQFAIAASAQQASNAAPAPVTKGTASNNPAATDEPSKEDDGGLEAELLALLASAEADELEANKSSSVEESPSTSMASISSVSSADSVRSLTEKPDYRQVYLMANKICFVPPYHTLPLQVEQVADAHRYGRSSPEPTDRDIQTDTSLHQLEMGTGKEDVMKYFQENILQCPFRFDVLRYCTETPISWHAIPKDPCQPYDVSDPLPDIICGYNRTQAFTPTQQKYLAAFGQEIVTNRKDVLLPFLVVEIRCDGGFGGETIWVTNNRCAGGCASAVNLAERLNVRMQQCLRFNPGTFNTTVWGITMSGTEVRLFVAWKNSEDHFCFRRIGIYLLQNPHDYRELRGYVRNIIDYARGERLAAIRACLNNLDAEAERRCGRAAKKAKKPEPASTSDAPELSAIDVKPREA